MKYNVTSIEEYLQVIPADRKEIVLKVISLIKDHFPEITGSMEYNMPTFNPVCAIASQKHHISLYIYRTDLIQKYREGLGKLKVGKSCIRFKKMKQLPELVIRKILEESRKLEEMRPKTGDGRPLTGVGRSETEDGGRKTNNGS